MAAKTEALAVKATAPRRHLRIHPAFLFLTPYLAAMLLFSLGPALYSLLISFATFKKGVPVFFAAGLDNYITVFKDPFLWPAFWNVIKFVAISVPFGIIFVVFLSLLLHARVSHASNAFRTLYFIPAAVSGPALVLVFLFTLNPDLSVFRSFLHMLGFVDIKEVVNNNYAPFVFTLMGFYVGAGSWVAIFYGALQGIPEEIIEAAIIDGCSPLQLAWLIKRPLIGRYIAYMALNVLAGNVQLFVEPQLMSTVTATISKTYSPNLLAYDYAFKRGNFGAGAVISVMMMIIGVTLAYVVIKSTNFYSIEA
ncbi:MAG: sugar ABC transporter permease [Chloroflexi bacterium]|nr:sugar ABC transporter permease [Chloroflexota bacterium]